MLEQSIVLCNAFDVQAGMPSILVKDNSIGSESQLSIDWRLSVTGFTLQVRGPIGQNG
jgi:hypothetical protein